MCGIVAYLGNNNAAPVLIKGLKRLEYRGYDSAGIAVWNDGLKVSKKAGKVAALEDQLTENELVGTVGIGHTRWATHGAPNDTNAHPHLSGDSKLAIIHNGIIENHSNPMKNSIKWQRGHAKYLYKTCILGSFPCRGPENTSKSWKSMNVIENT